MKQIWANNWPRIGALPTMSLMQDGQFGLYKNPDNGIIYVSVRKGDTGVPLEDILPETMRGEHFSKAPISGYIDMLYFWLTTDKALNATMKGKAKNADGGITINPPLLDLEALRLLTDDGEVYYVGLTTLCAAIASHWEKTPQVGMIYEMIKQGDSHTGVAGLLHQIAPFIHEGEGTAKTLDRYLQAQPQAQGLAPDKMNKMITAMGHFTVAICPPGFSGSVTTQLDGFAVSYMTIFSSWLRKTPRYHPIFATPVSHIVDIDFMGFDFRPAAKADIDALKKASEFIWHHRSAAPNPELLRAWLRDEVNLEGQPMGESAPDIAPAIFTSFEDWYRWQEYMLAQNKVGRDNFAIVSGLLEQHQSGKWTLPQTIIDNCHYFEAMTATASALKSIYAVEFIDFAAPQIDAATRPAINLKKAVTRKKISKRQLTELEEIVVYLLPPAFRVGLTSKLIPLQLEYLAKAAKWLRPQSHAVWKKPWSDGLDLLAVMVMDKSDPLKLSDVKPLARSIETHIDEPPRPDILEAATQVTELQPASKATKPDVKNQNQQRMRRLILDPSVKHFPGSKEPKDLILTRMGILRLDASLGIDLDRLDKFENITTASFARRNDPTFWLMAHLDMSVLLMNDIIDLDGGFLAEKIEVTPFLRKELMNGAEQKLWNKIAGLWLYPTEKKPLPDILTKYEAETLQIVCHWLDKSPRRPRPFFWAIQDMVWDQFRGSPPLVGDRMRQLAIYIHAHRDDPPDYEALKRV